MSDNTDPRFQELLTGYDRVETRLAALKEENGTLDAQRKALRQLLSTEVQNMGLGKGTVLNVAGVGSFHFTTQRGYHLPAEFREKFVRMLIKRAEETLLSITKADLNAWCNDMLERGEDLPPYLVHYDDPFVPSISLDSTKARRAEKQSAKAQK